ncbi:hypothetical protein ACFOQM_04105 [Paenibacillus sp. GCM10012307]|uniref:Uncharacterized protein n=1 Tax=Paenibacillus roseus TaxID=2798579 RepID=A0A934IWB3_9BACL|nr:hypothetical protein [Paenibacillus roseus]MBJ6360496.1 hypothetical protein [Paenibacillus roseus]
MLLGILYLITFIGLIGFVLPSFATVVNKSLFLIQNRKEAVKQSSLIQHFDEVMFLLTGKPNQSNRYFFYNGILFITSFFIMLLITTEIPMRLPSTNGPFGSFQMSGSRGAGVLFSLIVAVIVVIVGYLILRLQYHFRKIKSGYDLLEIVKILPRFADLQIPEAMIRTADEVHASNLLRKQLKILAFTVSNYSSEAELKMETNRFIKSVSTTFAIAFISDMLFSLRSGTPWRESLVSLGDSMETRLSAILEVKKELSGAIHMGTWGNPAAIILVCGAVALTIGFPVYAGLQFRTSLGITLLTIILCACVGTMILSFLVMKPPLDYK